MDKDLVKTSEAIAKMLREIDTRCLTQSVEKAKYNFGRRGIYNPHRSSCDYRGILQGEFPRENRGLPQKKLLSRLFIIITMEGVVPIENIDELTPDCLNDVYKDFANYLGMEMALKLYKCC